jgi:two-component sensor histidine kinase
MPRDPADRPAETAPGQTGPLPRHRTRRASDLLVLASLLLPALLFAAVATHDRAQALRGARRELLATLDTLHAHAEKVLQFQALALGALDGDLAGLGEAEILAAVPAHQARLAALRREAGGEIGIVVFGADGRALLDSDRPVPLAGVFVGDRAYFRHHRETRGRGPHVADPVISRADGSEILFVTSRRETPDGRFAGIVAAGIRVATLRDTWARAVPDPDAAVTLFRRDGSILARRPPLSPEIAPRFFEDGWVMRALANLPERSIATGPSPVDGSLRLFAFRSIARFPDLVISLGIGRDAALASWRRRTGIYGAFAAATGLALFLLAILARRREGALEALNEALERRVEERTAEVRASEAKVRLLAREVDHRAKNLLAVVQATLRLTPKESASGFAQAVEGRVAALGRAQTLLAEDQWRGAGLHALLESELAPFLAAERGSMTLRGEHVILPARLVQPIAMVVHELATNAVKHGALALAGGRVTVSWETRRGANGPTLALRWTERGGPPLDGPPGRRGFGSRLLGRVVEGQLGGRLRIEWDAAGLDCAVEVPIADGEHAATTVSAATA